MSLDELRLRATVLSHFEVPWLGPEAADDEAVDDMLIQDCRRVRASDGMRHWALDDSVRRVVASGRGLDDLRGAWRLAEIRPDDATQWAIDRLLGDGRLPGLDDLDPTQLAALEAVTRWLGVADARMPSRRALRRHIRLREFMEPLRDVATSHFVGRRKELDDLGRQLFGGGPPVLIYGFGGVGKTALLARHLLHTVEHTDAAVGYLNFDHGALDTTEPASLVRAMAQQLAWQLDDDGAKQAEDYAAAARDRLRTGDRELEVMTRSVQLGGERVADLLRAMRTLLPDARYLLVLDTLEEVQRRDDSALYALDDFVRTVRSSIPGAQVVLAGRAPAPELSADPLHLEGLERQDAIILLLSLVNGRADVDLDHVVDQVGTSPLCLRLAAGILRAAPTDQALTDLKLGRGCMEGSLYRRLLGHIADPDVRRLAHPGLTLRRVTPDVIRRVLAKPCGVAVPNDTRAIQLFEKLRREAMLVEPVPGDWRTVLHRTDVRRMMLEPLTYDDPTVVRQIHRRAIRYYEAQDDPRARTEAMYHRLMLGHRARTLDKHWESEMLSDLVPSLEELPPGSRAYLAARSGKLNVSRDDLRHAETATRRRLIVRNMDGFVREGRVSQALAVIEAYVDETGDRAPEVCDRMVQVLELQGRLADALEIAENERRRAARRTSTDDFFLFTLHVARLSERLGDPGHADERLDEALQLVRGLEPTEKHQLTRLQLCTARLALSRRASLGSPRSFEPTRDEALELFDSLSRRAVRRVPGLLRDLAAEVGPHAPTVVKAALRSVGIDASEEQVSSALVRVANMLSGDGEDASKWLKTQERGELGVKVSELLETAEFDVSEAITELVAENYASEADAALEYEPDHESADRESAGTEGSP